MNTPATPAVTQSRTAGCCCCLRWKGMYVDAEPDPTIPNMHSGLYWCSRTMTCLGPDGRVADPESCCEGRGCHEPW